MELYSCVFLYIISIHALRGEGDCGFSLHAPFFLRFQSTPSVGRATFILSFIMIYSLNFNPRPPWGGRHRVGAFFGCPIKFQSTPSVGRATQGFFENLIESIKFQSTPSVGRATLFHLFGADSRSNFNPRPPWGGRLQKYTNMQCYACT